MLTLIGISTVVLAGFGVFVWLHQHRAASWAREGRISRHSGCHRGPCMAHGACIGTRSW